MLADLQSKFLVTKFVTDIPTNLLGDFRDSALLSHKLYCVASWRYAALCFATALSSLAAFSVIGQAMADSAIQTGFTGPPSQLSFLDLHDGYSPKEAEALLKAWSPYGRRLYLLVEAIDCTVYHAGYRGFLVVVANRLAGALREKWPAVVHAPLALLAALPVLLAGLDFLEDTGQPPRGPPAPAPSARQAPLATEGPGRDPTRDPALNAIWQDATLSETFKLTYTQRLAAMASRLQRPISRVIRVRDSLPRGSRERLLLSCYSRILPVRCDLNRVAVLMCPASAADLTEEQERSVTESNFVCLPSDKSKLAVLELFGRRLTLMRHSYLTAIDWNRLTISDKKQLAAAMCHSTETQQTYRQQPPHPAPGT
ncbi:hypothetical protein COCSUDRAFT_61880 [Coccomyxa subellipsoidea C-169]|uniref:Uncharacterized protein n=1 Tax=Coccomyxa subellipsoidea (strain C-169) TaxID=574566 RepID=I0Z1D6_COCSC|nr:hypothetical protein COCSUDRAFT_61880 [Coccomyxa subellipsoidea C-169]EIE24455.1 hypothetical protein COCSUDRAFT_61880 [Coccomyxa subellipsoidea C-169]|eukprot:XP_005648999.1 hypothetical protein COCSUDRAFT_61880 [Coccomyxa subellipsoidea C-169]